METESLPQRLKAVWIWFLPAWLIPFYFLCLKIFVQFLGSKLALAGFVVLMFGSSVAIKAKRNLNWAEFYLFYVGIPLATLSVGFQIVLLWARFAG